MKILILGDIMGSSGRAAIRKNLSKIIKENEIDFSIINGENAADDGKGITKDIAEELFKQGIDVIVSANLTSRKYRLYCKKKFSKFLEVNISSNFDILKKRDIKKIYSSKNLSNVVGYGIKNFKSNTASLKLINNGSKRDFLKNCYKLIKIFKQK